MRYKVLACEVFFREVCLLAARSPHTIDLEFLPKGLHDLGVDRMRPRLQARIDAVDTPCDAVCLVYGLCNNGIAGLVAREAPLVIPRAHDCITLFLGSRDCYREHFEGRPGTYYLTTGWMEHADSEGAGEDNVCQRLGLSFQYDELVARYGQDNADYIMETLGDQTRHYDRMAYIDMGLDCEAPFRAAARRRADEKQWAFEVIPGSLDLLRKLLCGPWDDDILVIPPGGSIAPSHDACVMQAQNADGRSNAAGES